jgi:uncharacterized protein DUF4338/transposase-like protein/transposase Tn5 family protein
VRISGLEFSDEVVGRIRQVVQSEPELSRSALSRRICEWQGWRSPNGRLRQMSCRVALLKLERQNVIRLPASRGRPAIRRRMRPATAPSQRQRYGLSELQPIEVVPVGSADSQVSRIWNELMERDHPLGAGPLCGQQLRYLIGGRQLGWVGGLAFSAAAWQLKARDSWIGWTAAARQQNLSRVIANSRFLIRPDLEVPHLASHVLKLALGRVVGDWQQRYGCEPVLVETFVETGRFRGTCYQAANWVPVGQSAGRGRQDRHNRGGQAVKEIYLYPLHRRARRLLTTAPTETVPAAPVRSVLPAADWAEEEFGGLRLGDRRLEKRAVLLARDFAARPQAQIPQACQTRARTRAAYRFFDHPASDMNRLLESHYQASLRRVAQQKVVLAVQDTTSLNYSAHPATEDLGPIGSQEAGPLGLLVHDTMAFTVEGTPLGLLDLQCWARDGARFGKKHQRKQRPIEDKESSKWLESFRRVAAVQQQCPQTQLISVADRESDIYELFHLAQQDPQGPRLLIRAEQNRRLAQQQGHLEDRIRQQPRAGQRSIVVPRRGQRRARQAQLEVRFAAVTLQPPDGKARLGRLKLWAVLAEEVDVPPGPEPVCWLLLTTCPVETFSQALEKLDWYCLRWGIEVYHRTLKSGLKIEERQLGSADRIEACLAIDLVVAWRVFHLARLGREAPDLPCTVFFEQAEWKALTMFVQKTPKPPDLPPDLQTAMRMVASLGGFLGRKGDGQPGTKPLWLGLQRLDDIKEVWLFMANQFAPQLLAPPVSRAPT